MAVRAPLPPSRPDAAAVAALSRARVLILGDLMVDEYLMGEVERISPEAPVPVVRVSERRHVLGGAGNVARNVAALGGRPTLLSVIGGGPNGALAAGLAREAGIETDLVNSPDRRTIVKSRVMAQQQQMIRLDYEDVRPLRETELRALLSAVARCAPRHDVLVLSDYAKGIVSASAMDAVRDVLARHAPDVRMLVDPKPENMSCYAGAYLLTPNTREIGLGAGLPVRTPQEILKAAPTLLRRAGCERLVGTLGSAGMAVFLEDGEVWRMPTLARSVYDVTGAGDTVIATIALALAAGHPLLTAAEMGNAAAGVSVTKLGAATVTPEELRNALARPELPRPEPWMTDAL